jgi:transposase
MSKFSREFVVGIDVGSEFSYVAMLDPDGQLIRKAFRIEHNPAGFQFLLQVLKYEEERLNSKPIFFVESTGIYHLPLFFFLKSNDIKGFVVNPLCVHSNKKRDIRKVKNDKRDALAIAKAARQEDLSLSLVPEPQILSLRMLIREYFALADNLTDCKLRFSNDLHLLFPGFRQVFTDPFSAAALAILRIYPSLQSFKSANIEELTGVVAKAARRSTNWAKEKLARLLDYALIADSIGLVAVILEEKLRIQIQTIEALAVSMARIETVIRQQVMSDDFPKIVRQSIELLDDMPAIGFISAVTLLAEIGDFSKFNSPKAVTAFFGIDPSVNQSGKFNGDRMKMSKRGTKLGRRVLYTIAMASIRKTKTGDPINPVLKTYYEAKTVSKKKKVALVAIMHKLVHYIFAVLRDQKPFECRLPEDHRLKHVINQAA